MELVNLDLFKDPKLRLGLAPYVGDIEGVMNDYLFNEYENRLLQLPAFKYIVVEKNYDPALVSFQLYRTTNLWGPLLLYNGLDIFNWLEGTTVKAFNIRDYEVMLNDLLVLERTRQNRS